MILMVEERESAEGVLAEAEAARQQALTEDRPAGLVGISAEEAAEKLEEERSGVPPNEVEEENLPEGSDSS